MTSGLDTLLWSSIVRHDDDGDHDNDGDDCDGDCLLLV